jgi:acyl-CoA thioesterase
MRAKEIVNKMMASDHFSKWLGIQVIKVSPGYCKLKCSVKRDVLNGFGIAHGGFTYSIADSALAFAANSSGNQCLSVETIISHTRKLAEGDLVTAEALLVSETSKFGYFEVKLTCKKQIVAIFKGTVFKTEKKWATQ